MGFKGVHYFGVLQAVRTGFLNYDYGCCADDDDDGCFNGSNLAVMAGLVEEILSLFASQPVFQLFNLSQCFVFIFFTFRLIN